MLWYVCSMQELPHGARLVLVGIYCRIAPKPSTGSGCGGSLVGLFWVGVPLSTFLPFLSVIVGGLADTQVLVLADISAFSSPAEQLGQPKGVQMGKPVHLDSWEGEALKRLIAQHAEKQCLWPTLSGPPNDHFPSRWSPKSRALGAPLPKGIDSVCRACQWDIASTTWVPILTLPAALSDLTLRLARVPLLHCAPGDFSQGFFSHADLQSVLNRARTVGPCVVLIDDIDQICPPIAPQEGELSVADFARQICDLRDTASGIVLIGCTHRRDSLPMQMTVQFDQQVRLELPTQDERIEILQVQAEGKPIAPSTNWEELAALCAGLPGASIASALNSAALLTATQGMAQITSATLKLAMQKVREEHRAQFAYAYGATSADPDYYKILGLNRGCDAKEVKKAYRKIARTSHPDVNKEPDAADKFKQISEAYQVWTEGWR